MLPSCSSPKPSSRAEHSMPFDSNPRSLARLMIMSFGRCAPTMAPSRAKLRGLESNGMLCSARELGLGDEHDGIMELPDSLPLNQDLREALDLDDVMLIERQRIQIGRAHV